MKNVSKICLGLVTLFSLTACGKGNKCSKEDFIKEVKSLKETSVPPKATIAYDYSLMKAKNGEKDKEAIEGRLEFKYDSENGWEEDTHYYDDFLNTGFFILFKYIKIIDDVKLDYLKDSDKKRTINYYIKPFGIEETTKIDDDNWLDSFGFVSKGNFYYYREWDEKGYLTKLDIKSDGVAKRLDLGTNIELKLTFSISYNY